MIAPKFPLCEAEVSFPNSSEQPCSFHKRARFGSFVLISTVLLFLAAVSCLRAQGTTLSVGDLQILGVTSDAPDSYSFVLWRDIAAGTVIRITDNSFTSAAGTTLFSGNENNMTLTFGSALTAGTVLRFQDGGSPTVSSGTAPTASGTLSGTANGGDQVFAYQGTSIISGNTSFSATLLHGFNVADTSWLTSGAADNGSSYLPTVISGVDANLDSANFDNVDYAGVRTGMTTALYRAAVSTVSNYTGSDTFAALSNTGFTIASSASIHWDANGTTAGDGGAGTWDTTTGSRFKNSAAGTTFFRWVNSSTGNNHTAVFGGTAGTVTVSGGVTASGLQFTTTGYTLTASTITLSGSSTPTIDTGSLALTTINSALAGSQGFTKSGSGLLVLGGTNTGLSGTVNHNGGTIQANTASALGAGTFSFGGYNKLILNVADGTSMTVATNLVLPATGTGGEAELIRVGDGAPTAGTTARLTGVVSGGVAGQIYTLLDSDQTGNHNNTLTLENATNTFSGTIEIWRGTLGFTSDGALGNANNTLKVNADNYNGGLRFDANDITLAATRTIQLDGSEVINTQANNATILGVLTGGGDLRKSGSGKLTISGANGISTLTGVDVSQGTLSIATNTLTSGRVVTTGASTVLETTGTLKLNARSTTGSYDAVSGSGSLNLRSTSSSALNPDISFNDNSVDESTANYGTAINVPVDLGSSQRFIWGKTNHNSVSQYLSSSGPDANFKGVISGSGGLTFVAQHRYDASGPMDVPFVLSAANTFTGMVEIQRGSVYLNNANALNQGNVLSFTPTTGNNANFFLYGRNASVSNLQSSGAGTSRIANGNAANPTGSGGTVAATLTVTQTADTTFSGTILNGFAEYDSGSTSPGALSLIKAGASKLTLTGTNTYTGTTAITNGTLAVNSVATNGTAQPLGQASTAITLGGVGTTGTLEYTGGTATLARPFTVSSSAGSAGVIRSSGAGTLTLSGTLTKDGRVLTLTGGAFNITGTITGASANSDLVVDAATVTLSNANTYDGPTYLRNAATVNANVANALPTSPARSDIIMDDTGSGSSTLALAASQSVASLTGAATSAVNLNANTLIIGEASGSSTFAGGISGANGQIVKDGASTQVFSGASTYSGSTTLNAGTLAVTNTTGSATGSGNVQVNSGATLRGTGTVAPASGGSVIVGSGATVSVGDSGASTGQILRFTPASGTITSTFQTGSILEFDIFSGAGLGDRSGTPAAADILRTGGSFVIQSGVKLRVNNPNVMTAFAVNDQWKLLDWTTLGGTVPTGTFDSALLELPTLTGLTWDLSQLYTTGNIIVAVPEPARAALLVFGFFALLIRRRR